MKISVVYITNGKNLSQLNLCIASAKKFASEIIVVGNVEQVTGDVARIEQSAWASSGEISKMRNCGAEMAAGDIIINADDDIYFPVNFKNKLIKYLNTVDSFESCTTRVIGINGSRYWDRAVHTTDGRSFMIDYEQSHPGLYYSGAFLIRSKQFAEKFGWDNNLKYYQKEDVEFSARLKQHGHSINIDHTNYVVHLDSRYISYRNGAGQLECDKNVDLPNEIGCAKSLREITAELKTIDRLQS